MKQLNNTITNYMSGIKRKRQKRSFDWEYFEMIINERTDAPKKDKCQIW